MKPGRPFKEKKEPDNCILKRLKGDHKTYLANTTMSIAKNKASDMSSIRLPLRAIPNAIMLLLCRDSLKILRTLNSLSTRRMTREDIELFFCEKGGLCYEVYTLFILGLPDLVFFGKK